MVGTLGPPPTFLPAVDTGGPVPYLGDPSGTIALANAQVGLANSLALSLVNTAATLVAPTISVDMPIDEVPPALSTPTLPTFDNVVWYAPGLPAAFSGSVDIEGLMPAPFDEDAPVLSFPTAPAAFSEASPTEPGVDLSFVDPTLTVNLPAPPNLLSISIAPFGGLTLPTFTATDPVLTAVAPSIREYVPGAQYTSSLLTALRTSLEARITTGGTGLNQDVENAIWDRGRERESRSQREAIDRLEQMEGMGFTLPPGVYLDARVKIITETDYAERGHSREVMIKSAELELDNVKHALTTAAQVEASLISYTNQVEQRLFESTKYATEAGVAIYNAQVQAFGELVRVYATKVQIYEAQIRGEIAKVEAYKAQIEAESAKAQVNTALVQQYRVQAEVALSSIEIYKAQIAGIQAKADIERAKIEIFGEQVRAYSVKVNAYTAGVEGFRASIEAERTKQQAYQSAVEAFRAQVDAGGRQIDARVAVYKSTIDAKNIEWEGYKATVAGESARVDGLVKGNQALADIYKAQVTGQSSFNDTLTKQWQATIERNGRSAEVAVSVARANSELYVTSRNLVSDAARVSGSIVAQLGAAALNAMNWSNSISNSYGVNVGHSSSNSNSVGQNESYSYTESHNFSE